MGHAAPTNDTWKAWFTRWFCSTNHKDIGTLYLLISAVMFLVGGAMAIAIRLELFAPGMQIMSPEYYNQMITLHGLIMVFGVAMPAFVGLANWQIPMMVGAPDMAFPRLNNWSFWILPFAFALLSSTLFLDGPAPDFGWTFYAPLSTKYGPASTDLLIFSVHLMGASSIMGSINILVTILNMRTPGMKLMQMPMFVWTWLITAFMLVVIMPVLAGCVTMMLTDRHFGTSFFDAAGGGDPLLFQHIFWFFGHPEVYVLILPAFGVMSEIIPTFSRKKLFGYSAMVYASVVISVLGFLVWAHHMFTVGMPLSAQLFFMYATMLVSVPTGVKIFNWVATMFRGSLTFETPMLFAIGFLCLFTFGGFSGLMLAIVPADIQYQDTYFVVAHFHYVLLPGSIFGILGGVYYWLPKWCGRHYSETLGQWHFWLSMIFLNLTFFPMHFLGLAGMPRRIPDYPLQFIQFNELATIGAIGFGLAQLFFVYNIYRTLTGHGKKATAQVWDNPQGLEWTLPSPAPYHSFSEPPTFPTK